MHLPIAIFLATLSIPASALASDFFVDRATGTGVAESDLAAVTELIRTSVAETGAHRSVGEAGQAEFRLKPKLLKLGSSLILTLEKIKGSDTVFSSQLKAAHVDELDRVAQRLTRAVIEGVPARGDARVGDVTDEEASQGAQRRPARKGYWVGLAPAVLTNLGTNGIAYYVGGGYAWDVNKAMIRIDAEGVFKDSASLGGLSLGTNIFLNDRDTAPFVGAGVGFGGAVTSAGSSHAGFMAALSGGLQFLRTSSVNVELGLRAGAVLAAPATGMPIFFALKLALYF